MTTEELVQEPSWSELGIDSDWLNVVLNTASTAVTLEIVSVAPVGTGQVANSLRITAREKNNPAAITTYVVKIPSSDKKTRQGALVCGAYLREIRFYEKLAKRSRISVPKVFHTAYEEESGNFMLLMEDLDPAVQGDQLKGCKLEQAEQAMIEIAKLNGTSWQQEDILAQDWLSINLTDLLSAEILSELWQLFFSIHKKGFSAEESTLATDFIAQFDSYAKRVVRKQCLVHNDYRIDNMLFCTYEDGTPEDSKHKVGKAITVVDWQTLSSGSATFDTAYFIGTSVPTELRRQHERALVALYHSELINQGVSDYNFDDCWQDYIGFAFSGFVMAIVASATVASTDRGNQMFFTMAKGSLQLALDHNALALLGG